MAQKLIKMENNRNYFESVMVKISSMAQPEDTDKTVPEGDVRNER